MVAALPRPYWGSSAVIPRTPSWIDGKLLHGVKLRFGKGPVILT